MTKIDFDKMQGLAPAVVQDADNGDVLIVGFINREALDNTLQSHPEQTLDEGRDQRKSSPRGLGEHR